MYYLIGKDLSYSVSKDIHNIVNKDYQHLELKSEKEVLDFLNKKDFKGLNVTIPYKELVAKNVDELVGIAKDINIVNTVVNKNGKLYGYNTDFDGIIKSLSYLNLNYSKENFLILGTGATSKTVYYALKSLGAINIFFCGRKSKINYKNVYEKKDYFTCIINTTPLGMNFNIYKRPLNINKFNNLKAIFDVIYNPNNTLLIQDAKNKKIKNINGLKMLIEQARRAEEIFLEKEIKEEEFDIFEKILIFKNTNIVLVGISGCGKTEIVKELSKKLNKKLIDTDLMVSSYFGYKNPKEIIETLGIEDFRKKESYIVKGISTYRGIIISTGGGVYTKKINREALKLNSIIFHVKRDFSKIDKTNRPLYLKVTPEKLYNRRKRFYNLADYEVDNDSTIEEVVNKILKIIKEKYEI